MSVGQPLVKLSDGGDESLAYLAKSSENGPGCGGGPVAMTDTADAESTSAFAGIRSPPPSTIFLTSGPQRFRWFPAAAIFAANLLLTKLI